MTGSVNMESAEGTWKLEGDSLTFSISVDENPVDIIRDFEFKDDFIHLKRTSHDGSTSVVNSFKRKSSSFYLTWRSNVTVDTRMNSPGNFFTIH